MTKHRRFIFIALFIGIFTVPHLVTGQESDTCPQIAEKALAVVGETCGDLERNEACYGHNRVDAQFWEPDDSLIFSTPSDRVPILQVSSIATAPLDVDSETWGLAVLKVQANIPDSLPGQAVTFLLMGDAQLENAVAPDEATAPVTPVAASVKSGANLRSLPATTANVIGGAAAGDTISLVGINDAGDWYEIVQDDGSPAWIWSGVVDVNDVTSLPVTYGEGIPPRYGPMQAFHFSTGIGQATCEEAPDALVIQSPQGLEVAFNMNGLDVALGSTVVFSTVSVSESSQQALVATLIEGHLSARSEIIAVELAQPGETLTVTLNEQGQVDENSELVDVDAAVAAPVVEAACTNARQTGAFEGLTAGQCGVDIAAPGQNETPESSTTTTLSGAEESGSCTVSSANGANLRGGPGTNYALAGSLSPDQTASPNGQAIGADGFVWWRLSGGAWVRGDVVGMTGACGSIPVVETPAPPVVTEAPPVPDSSDSGDADVYSVTFTNSCNNPALDIPVFLTQGPQDYSFVVPQLSSVTMSIQAGSYHIRFLHGNGVDWWDFDFGVDRNFTNSVCQPGG